MRVGGSTGVFVLVYLFVSLPSHVQVRFLLRARPSSQTLEASQYHPLIIIDHSTVARLSASQ